MALAILCATLGGTQLLEHRMSAQATRDMRLTTLPAELGPWKAQLDVELSESHHEILKLDEYVRRLYKNDQGQEVFVYVGYWKRQSSDHQAAKHSPLMCLPANGWKITPPFDRAIPLPESESQQARRLVGTIKQTDELFNYWFFSGERIYTDESAAMIQMVREALVHARSDGGIVELSTPVNPRKARDIAEGEAQQVLDTFAAQFVPELNRLIRSAAPVP